MKFTVPASVASLEDVRALITEVRDYRRWYSHNSIRKQVGAAHTADTPELSPAARELIRTWSAQQPLSAASLDDLLTRLEHFRASAPSLTITLAAPASSSLKQQLVAWCRTNLASDVLVNFQFNSTLLGGMVVRCGSRIFDWSFRQQLLNNRAHFPEVLRRV